MFEPEVIHFGKKKFSEVTMFGENQSLKSSAQEDSVSIQSLSLSDNKRTKKSKKENHWYSGVF
jgi:hypothetical protein